MKGYGTLLPRPRVFEFDTLEQWRAEHARRKLRVSTSYAISVARRLAKLAKQEGYKRAEKGLLGLWLQHLAGKYGVAMALRPVVAEYALKLVA